VVVAEVIDPLMWLHAALLKYTANKLLLAPEDVPILIFCAGVAPLYKSIVDAHPKVCSELYLIPTVNSNCYHGCL
jgi:hypothetical protein